MDWPRKVREPPAKMIKAPLSISANAIRKKTAQVRHPPKEAEDAKCKMVFIEAFYDLMNRLRKWER